MFITDLYVKSTDRNNLLQYGSNHPKRRVDSLLWSQLLRIRLVVSQETAIDERLDEICSKFISTVQGYRKIACEINRNTLLKNIQRKEVPKRIQFVTTYGPDSGRVANIVRRKWHILQRGCPTVEEYNNPPFMSYRRAPCLKDHLVKSDIGSFKSSRRWFGPMKMGNFPCLGWACCNHMVRGHTFGHPQPGQIFKIKQRYTCTSRFVVYVITCPCGLMYMGETTMEIRMRISKHKSTICPGLNE